MTFDEIIKHFGTQAAVAKAVGADPVTINHWKRRGVPNLRQIQIQVITKGALKAEQKVKRAA